MTSNPSQMYLVDLDDALLNTSKYKSDLFSNLAKTINPAGSYKESFVKIAELYTFYCQKNQEIFSYSGFASFLVEYFGSFNQDEQIRNCFHTNYNEYLMPQAKELLNLLGKKGKVVIWTTGAYEDQLAKLLNSGLLTKEQENKVVNYNQFTEGFADGKPLPLAIVDLGKGLDIKSRLINFIEHFENNNITLIDNRSKNVMAVSEINHPNLYAYWFEHGQPKKPERVKSLRENLPANILRFERLSEIISHMQQEGVNISPERKG